MKNSDIVKIREHFQDLMDTKTLIITKDQISAFTGKCTEVEKYKIYTLERSIGPRNIKNDELFHKIKPIVAKATSLVKQQALIYLQKELKQLYPYNNVNIWVWNAKAMEHSGWNNTTAWACFKASEDSSFGHDVLVIIK